MAFVQLISRLDDLSEYIRTISVASDIGIKILGATSQSAEHFRVADVLDTTIHLNVDSNGDVGIGATPSSANLEITRTRTDTSGTRRGIYSNITASPASDSSSSFRGSQGAILLTGSANFTGICYGHLGTASTSGSGTVTNLYGGSFSSLAINGGTVTNAFGVLAVAQISSVASTITNALGGQFQVVNAISGGAISSGQTISAASPTVSAGATITTQEGVRVQNQGATGITTSYGVRVRSQTGASTSHSIFSEGGQSTLQAGASGTIVLILQGAASQSVDHLQVKDSGNKINALIDSLGAAAFKPRDAVTNTIVTGLTVGHNSSGTPTTAYGAQIQYVLKSSTTEDQAAAEESVEWATATHASRKARFKINVYDTAARECLRAEASGTAPMIGFLGAAAVIRTAAYTVTNPTTDRALNVTADTLAQGLQVLGTLISDLQGFGLLG